MRSFYIISNIKAIMEPLTRGTRGAEFVKVDLHVHTPGSHDYKEDDVSPEDFVQALREEDIDLVAITDHDCSGWYEEIREAAEDTSIKVLPGVEITTPQGSERQIHMTAIFPPEKSHKVEHVLSKIDIDPANPEDAQAGQKISNICDVVRRNGGLPILAHIDEKAGADYEIEGDGRIKQEIFDEERVAAIEVVYPETRDDYPGFPAIQSSDAHSREELGRGYTYLKVTEPSFEGFRTALSDPESRISLEDPERSYAWIAGIRCEGGFLDDRELRLNCNLNCLIGGKGTGKSTVIEHIRYALDITPRTDRIDEDYRELIEATLGPEGTVEIHLVTDDGQRYLIRRTYEEEPEIYRESGDDVEMDIQTFREQFFNVEIHSQRELLELARDDLDVLDLLDSYFDFDGAKREREDVKSRLGENAQKIIRAQEEKRALEDELRDFDAIKEQVAVMEEQGVRERIEDQEEWEKEDQKLRRFEENVEEALDQAKDLSIAEELETADELDDSPNEELIDTAQAALSDGQEDVAGLEEDIVEQLEMVQQTIEAQREEWNTRNEDRIADYDALAEEIKEETDVDIEEYFDLKEELNRLQQVKDDLDGVETRIQQLNEDRQELLSELEEAREEITDIRRAGIEALNAQLHDVRIRLKATDNKSEFIAWVSEVLKGSYVNTDDKERFAATFSPQELAQIVSDRDVDQIVDEVGVTETTAENIVNYEPFRERVYDLEIQEVHDRPLVEIQDGSQWKPLAEMSDGQRCTALLSIAMLERNAPLIIDQPEDMLDNEFIYNVVVDIIRRIKNSRQLIMPTHNANIPILGDAEQIAVMTSDGQNGYFSYRGSVDDSELREKAQDILEGGEEAFNKRNDKYGYESL